MIRTGLALALALVLAGAARAQQAVSQRRPASPDGQVEIVNPSGLTRVVGWERAEVQVFGTLGPRASGLDISGDGSRVRIQVTAAGNPLGISSTLEVRVPRRSQVHLKSFRARILVDDLAGSLTADSFEGSISVTRGPAAVTLRSTSGNLLVQAAARRMDLETVNGSITVREAGGWLSARTVNGAVTVVQGRAFDRVNVSTVSGPVTLEGSLAPAGKLEASSVNGPVLLQIPARTMGSFDLNTTNGRLSSDFGPRDRSRQHEDGGGQRHEQFTVGSGAARIEASSVNGNVTVQKR